MNSCLLLSINYYHSWTYCVTFMLYHIDLYRHMYNPLFRICFRCVPILVSFLWISNSSNLLIWIELYVIAWIPCVTLLSFPFKSEYNYERLLLTSDWLVKAHVRFVVLRVLPICAIHCSYYPFILWYFWDIVNLR